MRVYRQAGTSVALSCPALRYVWLVLDSQPRVPVNVGVLGLDISGRPENREVIEELVAATTPTNGAGYRPARDGQLVFTGPLLPLYRVRLYAVVGVAAAERTRAVWLGGGVQVRC